MSSDDVALSSILTKVEDETARDFNRHDADIEAIRKDVGAIDVRMAAMTGEMNLIKRMLGTTPAAVLPTLFRVLSP